MELSTAGGVTKQEKETTQRTSLGKSHHENLRRAEDGFWRVRSQMPSSVSFFLALTEFRGESSVSAFQPILLCPNVNLPSFSQGLTEFGAELGEFYLPKQSSRNSIPPVSHCFLFLN